MGFGIPGLPGQNAQGKRLIRVGFNVVPAILNLNGYMGIGAVLMHAHDEILIHGVIDGLQLRDGFALNHALDIAVAHPVGRVRGDSRLDCLAYAQGGKAGAADDGLKDRILAFRADSAGHQPHTGNGALIIQIPLPHHVQKNPLRKPDAHPVVLRLGLHRFAARIPFSEVQVAAVQLFPRDTVVYHQGVLEKQHGGNHGQLLHQIQILLPPDLLRIKIRDKLLQCFYGYLGIEYGTQDIDGAGHSLPLFKNGAPHESRLSSQYQRRRVPAAVLHHIGLIPGVLEYLIQNQMLAVRADQMTVRVVFPQTDIGSAPQQLLHQSKIPIQLPCARHFFIISFHRFRF